MAGGHTSEKRWETTKVIIGNNTRMYPGISDEATSVCRTLINSINMAEEAYQSMQEIYTYAGGTDTDLAALLFKEDIAARGESTPSTEEIAKASDLVGAMVAAHQIWQAANNIAVTQSDRMTSLRRMG